MPTRRQFLMGSGGLLATLGLPGEAPWLVAFPTQQVGLGEIFLSNRGEPSLTAALDYGALVALGASSAQAIASLRKDVKKYGVKVLNALATVRETEPASAIAMLPLDDLEPGMTLEEEVRNQARILIVGRGHELTFGTLTKLRNYVALGSLQQETFRVRVPPGHQARATAA